MVDVTRLPDDAFGYVPTPALVAPIEFTMRRDLYARSAGMPRRSASLDDVLASGGEYLNDRRSAPAPRGSPWPLLQQLGRGVLSVTGPQIAWLADGRRLHLNHGPIDLILETFGDESERRAAHDARRSPASRRSWKSWSPSCPSCRKPAGATTRVASPARPRAAWSARSRNSIPNSSRRWRRSPARSPTRSWPRCSPCAELDKAYVNNGGDIAIHLRRRCDITAAIAGTGQALPTAWSSAPPTRCAASPPAAGAAAASRSASPTR